MISNSGTNKAPPGISQDAWDEVCDTPEATDAELAEMRPLKEADPELYAAMTKRGRGGPPTHPGAILREDVLPHLSTTVEDLAGRLGVSCDHLAPIIAEQSPVSPEMALRFGKLLGNGPSLWLRMQEARDLWEARARIGAELDRIVPTSDPPNL